MKQQWEIDRENSTPSIAAYLAKRLPKDIDVLEIDTYLRNNKLPLWIGRDRMVSLDFWKNCGWQGASDDEFLSILIPLIIEELAYDDDDEV